MVATAGFTGYSLSKIKLLHDTIKFSEHTIKFPEDFLPRIKRIR